MISQKPRVQIDLKTVIFIMAFFGVGTWGSMLVFIRKAAWVIVEPPARAAASEIVLRERARTDSVLKAAADSVRYEMRSGFGRIGDMLIEMPGGKKAAQKLQERARDRVRFGASLPAQDIIIF